MPFEGVVKEATAMLSEVGFEPLDKIDGRIGGERHGI